MAGRDQRLTLSFKKTSWKQLRPPSSRPRDAEAVPAGPRHTCQRPRAFSVVTDRGHCARGTSRAVAGRAVTGCAGQSRVTKR